MAGGLPIRPTKKPLNFGQGIIVLQTIKMILSK
jgi:hypothetical protein